MSDEHWGERCMLVSCERAGYDVITFHIILKVLIILLIPPCYVHLEVDMATAYGHHVTHLICVITLKNVSATSFRGIGQAHHIFV